jgi:putative ABC transport system permease protein
MRAPFSLARFVLAGIRHRPGRNLAVIFCFAFIAANLFSAQYLLAGAAGGLDTGASRMGADLLVIPAGYVNLIQGFDMGPVKAGTIIRVEPSTLRMDDTVMDAIGKSPEIAALSPQIYVATLSVPALSPAPVDVYGIDPVTDFAVRPWLKAQLKNQLGRGDVLVGSALGADAGSSIVIGGSSYTVAGKLEPTRSATDQTVFMTLDDAFTLAAVPGVLPATAPALRPGMVNAILLRVEPGRDPALAAARVQQPFSLGQIRVLEKHGALETASQAVRGLPGILTAITLVVIFAAFPLVGLIAAMAAHERQREIGLLLSMGARKKQIFFMVMAESLLLAIAGGIAGVGTCLGIFFLNNGKYLQIPFLQGFDVPPAAGIAMMAGITLGIVILVGSLAALWPAWRSSRMNPYDAIRDES